VSTSTPPPEEPFKLTAYLHLAQPSLQTQKMFTQACFNAMTRPINQELYVLHRPQRIVEVEEDAIQVSLPVAVLISLAICQFCFETSLTRCIILQEILSGYCVSYSCHRDIAQVCLRRQPREQAGLRGWRSISAPSFSTMPTAETAQKQGAVETNSLHSKPNMCDNTNAYMGTSTLMADDDARVDNKASRAA
jgi:hypothetical protein